MPTQCRDGCTRQTFVLGEQPTQGLDLGEAAVRQHCEQSWQELQHLAVGAEKLLGDGDDAVALDGDELVVAKQLMDPGDREAELLGHVRQLEHRHGFGQYVVGVRDCTHTVNVIGSASDERAERTRVGVRDNRFVMSVRNRSEDDVLDGNYRECKRINRRHGKTYYWSTNLLPREVRPHVHALYALCRLADDIVDVGAESVDTRLVELKKFESAFFAARETGRSDHPVLSAAAHTAREFGLQDNDFRRFFTAMYMDFEIERYETFDDLLRYMDGSAAVIGEMLLPLFGADDSALRTPAAALGVAFQLTNFLRDVAEDLDRHRIYLPQAELAQFGAADALTARQVTPEWEQFMQFQLARTREYYELARPGLDALPGRTQRCVGAAWRLYGEILDRIEAGGYDVFSRRAAVPMARKVAIGLGVRRPGSAAQYHRTLSVRSTTQTKGVT